MRRRTGAVVGVAPWTAALLMAVTLAGPGAAQSCGLVRASGVEAGAGYMSYDIGRGVSGPAFGVGATVAGGAAGARLEYVRPMLDGPDPAIVRAAAAVRLIRFPGGTAVCATGRGGSAFLNVDGERSSVMAGGIGVRVARAFAPGTLQLEPFAEARGLAARSGGTILGVDVEASGLAVGVAGGVGASIGRVTAALSASLDGFDGGLGVTPYPSAAVRAMVGVRF